MGTQVHVSHRCIIVILLIQLSIEKGVYYVEYLVYTTRATKVDIGLNHLNMIKEVSKQSLALGECTTNRVKIDKR